jgi:hypothetical protein
MPPVGFKPTISADERPETYTLDRAATGIGNIQIINNLTSSMNHFSWKKVRWTGHATRMAETINALIFLVSKYQQNRRDYTEKVRERVILK